MTDKLIEDIWNTVGTHEVSYEFYQDVEGSDWYKEILEYKKKAEQLDLFNFHKDHLGVLKAFHDEMQQNKQRKEKLSKIEKWAYNSEHEGYFVRNILESNNDN